MDLADLPEMLRVEEAAAFLRIGRNRAYEETARFLHTGGATGLPCIRIGRSVRVPRHALAAWVAEQLDPHDSERREGDTDAA
jgi:excisionase family DNA binding protein